MTRAVRAVGLSVDRPTRAAVAAAVGTALLWAALAAARPKTTFHLAPLIVVVAAPYAYRSSGGADRGRALWLTLGAATLTAALIAVLAIGGRLEGPSLLPAAGAAAESWVGAAVGLLLGLGIGLRRPVSTR